MPNGCSEPDFPGWVIKQFGVRDFTNYRPISPVTLLTPEPTGGFYRDKGADAFVRRFGYPDKSGIPNRINFGGIYVCGGTSHAATGLRLDLLGYDQATGKITDMDGGIALIDHKEEIAALWEFPGIISHWSRKHAQAAYVPSLFRSPPPEYRYGPHVLLCEETDLTLLLKAIANGIVYYDPALKIAPNSSGRAELKRRSQFRILHRNLGHMYLHTEISNLAG